MNYTLITGSTSGIGLDFARRLAKLGHNVFLVSNQEKELLSVSAELEKDFGIKTKILFIDLAREEAAYEVFDFCQKENIKVNILVNNAGMFFFKYFSNTDISLITKILYLHVFTPVLLCKLFSDEMKKSGEQCHILNMSSIAAYMKLPTITLYGSTKALLKNFSNAIYEELLHSNISVTTVCPGAVATDLYNLSEKYKKLGVKLGIIIPPEKLVEKAISKMFKRKKQYIPAPVVNRPAIWLTSHLPSFIIQIIMRKIEPLMKI